MPLDKNVKEQLIEKFSQNFFGTDVRILGTDYEGKDFTGKDLNLNIKS